MNDLTIQNHETPKTIEEKTKYVLFGTEALNIYRAKLKAMEKAGISKEQYEQLKIEAQETAENLLLFSADIGKEMQKIEKATPNNNPFHENDVSDNLVKKADAIHSMGFTDRQARDFQTLAKHPEVINKAIEDARAEDRIVTRSDVLNRIAPPKTHKQTMNDIKRQAQQEHEEFKSSPVVDMEDAKKDKENIELLALDVSITIKRALAGVTGLGMLKESEIELMKKSLKPFAKQDMISNCYAATRTITHILKIIGG